MTETSGHLGLPYIAAAQAQKHVTHNAAVRHLDALVQLTLESLTLAAPPVGPSAGACWFVPAGASGAWSGKAGMLAASEAGAWDFLPCQPGFRAYVRDQRRVRLFDGTSWVSPLAASVHRAAIEALVLEEDVALSGAATATSIAIPDRGLVLAVSTLTLEAVTGAASYDCGTAAERAKFGGTLGVSVGAVNVGVVGPTAYYAATPIRLSANAGSFTGGRVRVAI
ncbi:MAG: ribonuclease III, partial [Rhizobiales bacterium 32-66-8]